MCRVTFERKSDCALEGKQQEEESGCFFFLVSDYRKHLITAASLLTCIETQSLSRTEGNTSE